MEKQKSGIFAGIMLIGLGILFYTGWWWPGIMLVIGTALGVDKFLQGQIKQAIGLFLLFLAIPAVVFVINSNFISPAVFVPVLLIAIGALVIGRSFFNKAQQ